MIVTKLRAAATALLLGMAVVSAGGILTATQAEAAGVRPAVGNPLNDAMKATRAGNYSAAQNSLRQAEGVSALTETEKATIAATRKWVESQAGGAIVSSAIGAQAKFDSDYRGRKYRDVIADEDLLRKYGALNGTNMVIIAQAYYQSGDNRGCVRYANSHSGAGASMLDLALRCAYETHDQALMRDAAESLVAASGTPKNWAQLLNLAESTKQLSDPQTLDIYRLKYLSGAIKNDEYMPLAQQLIAARLNSEARAVAEKGMAAKAMVDARAQRLYAMTKQNQAADLANLAKTQAAAQKSPQGDDLIRLGENYTGMGNFPEAIQAIQAGIGKGVKDPDNAQVRLAVAYFGAKQKPQALAALAKANKTPNGEMVARLWTIYIRQH
jgi:hypothetical protein